MADAATTPANLCSFIRPPPGFTSIHATQQSLERTAAECDVAVLWVIVGEHVGAELPSAMIGSLLLWQPPTMRNGHDLRMRSVVRVHFHAQPAAYRLNPCELAGCDTQCRGRVVVHFHERFGRESAQGWNLPALRVVEHRLLRTGDEQQRVVLEALGCVHR